MAKQVGTVIQVMGPVLDIRFPEGCLPRLLNAVEVPNGDETIVAEVAQHLGDNVVRAVAMHSTDGLQRGAPATDTGAVSSSWSVLLRRSSAMERMVSTGMMIMKTKRV